MLHSGDEVEDKVIAGALKWRKVARSAARFRAEERAGRGEISSVITEMTYGEIKR